MPNYKLDSQYSPSTECHYHKLSEVTKPSNTALVGDGNWRGTNYDCCIGCDDTHLPGYRYKEGETGVRNSYNPIHSGGANICFVDGHGEWVRKERILLKDSGASGVSGGPDPGNIWDLRQ